MTTLDVPPTKSTVTMKRAALIWIIASALLSPLGLAIAGIVYTGKVEREQDTRWKTEREQRERALCDLLIRIDNPRSDELTPAMREFQRDVEEARRAYECDRLRGDRE